MDLRCVSSYALIQLGHTSRITSDATTPKAQTARMTQALRFPFAWVAGVAAGSLNQYTSRHGATCCGTCAAVGPSAPDRIPFSAVVPKLP